MPAGEEVAAEEDGEAQDVQLLAAYIASPSSANVPDVIDSWRPERLAAQAH